MEAEPVAELILGLIVRQRIQRLQHKHPEHQHRVVGWATATAAVGSVQPSLQVGPEHLEVHHSLQALQRITRHRQRSQPLVRIKETSLLRHRCLHTRDNQRITSPAAPL
jgi:hypothetical protein